MINSVLVLDGTQRSALAAARSLGRQGLRVYVGAESTSSLAAGSRHCAGSVLLPSATSAPEQFVAAVIQTAADIGVGLVMPMTDASTMLLAENGYVPPSAGGFRLAVPPVRAYETLSDKAALSELAGSLSVPVPNTLVARTKAELELAVREIGLPCVLKPARSRIRHEGRLLSTGVSIVNSFQGLRDHAVLAWLECMPVLVQQFIPGSGAGVFALYGPAGPVAWFAHRRLREKPPSGGVSVLSESAPADPVMQSYAERLLSSVGWFGPAMVEFRIDPEGRPWLMEVNGRFWGSLQLAIDCGVDFPWLFYRLCQGEKVQGPGTYETGRRLRWLLGDLDHLLLQLRGKGTADTLGRKLSSVSRFLDFFDPATRLEVLRRDDFGPFRHELRAWLSALGRS